MEEIIIIWEKEILNHIDKEILNHIDSIKNITTSNAIDALIIDPFESPNYEEIIENIKNSSVFIPIDTVTKRFGKEIEKFNKALEPKPQKILDINSTIDETPWYDIFLKKWNKHIYKSSKPNSKKKWNKRK